MTAAAAAWAAALAALAAAAAAVDSCSPDRGNAGGMGDPATYSCDFFYGMLDRLRAPAEHV